MQIAEYLLRSSGERYRRMVGLGSGDHGEDDVAAAAGQAPGGMQYSGVASDTAPPRGFHSVTPRMVVSDVHAEVEFLRAVFHAAGEVHAGRPAEIRIGDSLVMVTRASDRALFPAFLYVYVDDADRAYRRALDAGAVSMEEPFDTPYGDRRAMVRDPSGNVFQIAHRMAVQDGG